MNTLELNQFGLVEMNSAEMTEVDGGSWVALGIALGISLINNWGDFIDGISDGYNAAHSN